MKAYVWPVDGSMPPTTSPRWRRFIENYLPMVVIYLMVATLVAFLIAPNVIVTVPTGHVGILWKRFRGGTQLDPRLLKDEGMRVLLPWDKLFLYDLRLQTHTDTYNAISKDGAYLTTTINIRFRLKHDAVPQLHQTIGPDYVKRMLSPEIGNRAREIFACPATKLAVAGRRALELPAMGRIVAVVVSCVASLIACSSDGLGNPRVVS